MRRWIRDTIGYCRRTLTNPDGWCHLVPRMGCAECRYFWADAHGRLTDDGHRPHDSGRTA